MIKRNFSSFKLHTRNAHTHTHTNVWAIFKWSRFATNDVEWILFSVTFNGTSYSNRVIHLTNNTHVRTQPQMAIKCYIGWLYIFAIVSTTRCKFWIRSRWNSSTHWKKKWYWFGSAYSQLFVCSCCCCFSSVATLLTDGKHQTNK